MKNIYNLYPLVNIKMENMLH